MKSRLGSRAFLIAVALLFSAGSPQSGGLDGRRSLARANYEEEKYSESVEMWEAIVRSEGGSAQDHLNLGLALLAEGRTGEALAALETARQMAPDDARVYFALGILQKRESRFPLAAVALARARSLAPRDIATLFNLGVVYTAMNQRTEALECFEQTIRSGYLNAPPFYVASLFRTFTLLNRMGRKAEAQRAYAQYRELEQSTTQSNSARALESGPFLQMRIEPGAAPVAGAAPARFLFEAVQPPFAAAAARISVVDYDQDGRVDLLLANPRGASALLLNNGNGTFRRLDLPEAEVAACGDIDNDGRPDLFLAGRKLYLFRNKGDGTLEDVSQKLPTRELASGASFKSAFFFDYDADGDLDLLLVTSRGVLLFRNDASGFFTDVTVAAKLDSTARATAAAFADFDGDNSLDLVIAGEDGVRLLLNTRNGAFQERRIADSALAVEVADFDADGRFDVALLSRSGVRILRNLGDARFAPLDLPGGRFEVPDGASLTLMDYDRDGLTDILAIAGGHVYAVRNGGRNDWTEISQSLSLPSSWKRSGPRAVVAGDLFGNGRFDLAQDTLSGQLQLARNAVPEKHGWLKIQLEGMKSNRFGVGSTVELKAGPFFHKALISSAPLLVGTADLQKVDVVRVTWPNGVLMNQIGAGRDQTLHFREANRLASSCPLLYTWNGSQFVYITDTLGNAPLGTPDGRGGYWLGNHRELTPIPDGQLQPFQGRFEIRLTEELREVTYLDHVRLIAVDHRETHAVYTNDRYAGPPYPEPEFYDVSGLRPVVRAVDDHGHDLTRQIREVDGDYTGDFALSRIPGLAGETHALTLELGDLSNAGSAELYFTGWVYWMDSNGLIAASGAPVLPPYLQVSDGKTGWTTVIQDMGLPTGTGKSVRVDLRGKFPAHDYRARVVTNLCVYWDRILVASASERARVVRELAPRSADLHYRGFSEVTYDENERQPDRFNYQRLLAAAPWNMHQGRYTRYGDVITLLREADDRFAVLGAGDELAISFDASTLPPVPAGWKRSFFLDATGWVKDGEPNTAHSNTVEPLPFRGMPNYPYDGHRLATAKYRQYLRQYQTRAASPLIAPLDPVAK